MAKNTGKGYRAGAVKNRSEFRHPNGTYVKRDTTTGQILNVSDRPHKGVRDESGPSIAAVQALPGSCQRPLSGGAHLDVGYTTERETEFRAG